MKIKSQTMGMIKNHRIKSFAPELPSDLLVTRPGFGLSEGFWILVVSRSPIIVSPSEPYNYLPG
jgi:hypothetical protein